MNYLNDFSEVKLGKNEKWFKIADRYELEVQPHGKYFDLYVWEDKEIIIKSNIGCDYYRAREIYNDLIIRYNKES